MDWDRDPHLKVARTSDGAARLSTGGAVGRWLPGATQLPGDRLPGDEVLDHVTSHVVGVLRRRRLHEVGGGADQWSTDAAVERQLGAAHRVDHHAGGIRRVPDLQLELEVQRDVPERPTLDADVAPFAVVEPGHVVAGPDVDVALAEVVLDLGGDRLGLGDLLGLQPIALQHVLEVHVPTEVELVGAVDGDTAVLHQAGEHAVHDGGADLGLDVVADDRHAGRGKPLGPIRRAGDEHRQAVHEGDLGSERLGGVVAGRLLGAHRQVGDEHVGVGGLQRGGDVDRGGLGLSDRLGVIAAEPVERAPTLDLHPEGWHVCESDGVVLAGGDRLREVAPDLLGVDVEGGDELEVTDVVAPDLDVHETGDVVAGLSVPVIVDALHQGRRAVAHTGDRDAYLGHFLIATPHWTCAAYPV